MRLGLLGGTFDPPHHGHLRVARIAQDRARLDAVLFVPCFRQPLKPRPPAASGYHRAAMVALALSGRTDWGLETAELERKGTSYTADTVELLMSRMPGAEVFLLLGADSLASFRRWKRYGFLLEACRIVAVPRPGVDLAASVPSTWRDRVLLASARPSRVSSTMVRARAARGESLTGWAPASVARYIVREGLYGAAAPHIARGRHS
ncbi:MAG: nicotinate-nucleotide adenylyltransferase [Acidobacteriota bacterium]